MVRLPLTFLFRTLLALAAMLTFALPVGRAQADDVSATARGVVRVVTIATVDDQVVGFGHGSGFAVGANRIVTNAHVVELAQRYPGNVVIGVVPSEGSRSYEAKVVAYDSARDLALLEFDGARLPPVTLFNGAVNEGDRVTALGYPGNVDLATAQSATDYITPSSPVRSEGVLSGSRALSGVNVLLHSANIARGNSGGPLLDPCGRVIGVNSAITQGEEGDATFAFAIADGELTAFLRQANQPFQTVDVACTSIEDRLRQDNEVDVQSAASAETARRDAAAQAQVAREDMLAKARDSQERLRENVMAVAALLLVAGAMVIGGAGLLETRGRRTPAIWTAAGGGGLIVAAVFVFVLRPNNEPTLPDDARVSPVSSTLADGKLLCHFQPDRSRVTVSSPKDVTLGWTGSGCINGKTQYLASGGQWSRVLIPDDEQTASALSFDPVTRTYSSTRYLLTDSQMATLRKLRDQAKVTGCSTAYADTTRLTNQQGAIRAALPPLPNEKLVYACAPAPAGSD
jgi:V8-like Glu-specific endopeptidase